MADVIEIPAGKKVVKLPVADNDFGKVHSFTVPLKNGDAQNCAVLLFESETSEIVVAKIHPGETRNLRLGAKSIFVRSHSDATSGLTMSAVNPVHPAAAALASGATT